MADVSKAQKLASARKKFKELKKEKQKGTTPKDNNISLVSLVTDEQTPTEDLRSRSNEQIHLPEFFSDVVNEHHKPAAFFDTFIHDSTNVCVLPGDPSLINYFSREDFATDQVDKSGEESREKIDVGTTEFQTFDRVKLHSLPEQTPQLSSIESLCQISDQMAALIDPQTDPTEGESDLKIRNQELASLLEQEIVRKEQLNMEVTQYRTKLSQLELQLRDRELNMDHKIETKLSSLREELQCHVQTVGILVAEKTELAANLSQFQLVAKQKSQDCEELQGRLKTSRSRVADLERELSALRNERSQYDHQDKAQNVELVQQRRDYQRLKEEREELIQDLLEVREKLKTAAESNLLLQEQVGNLSNQLSMASIKIQQLTTSGSDQVNTQVEQLTQEKFILEKQILDLNQTVKSLSKDREESSLQYQQYAQQLNSQLSNFAAKLDQLQKENESLSMQEQNRIKHIGDLERQLQSLQLGCFSPQKFVEEEAEEIVRLRSENVELQEENLRILHEKDILIEELKGRDDNIRGLQELVEELKVNQPDNVKLLAVMESDKVAAARAVAQNAEMKKQMESMEEVFLKLNNDKVELTENLTKEQHNSKELFEKLQKTEIHLQTLADAIEVKDRELVHLREDALELDKRVLQSEQLADRLRHYEAHDHSSHSLQTELQEAQQTVIKLTEEVNSLRLTKSGQDEFDNLHQQLQNIQLKNIDLEAQLYSKTDGKEEVEDEKGSLHVNNKELSSTDRNHNNSWTVLDRESAMKNLEEKFLRTMKDIANLTEEKQRLEHLVLQLQGETETIGEYVALYQHQRSVLKQRAIEKDQQLTQLANDREVIKGKLEKLNGLVRKLVMEKGAVPKELLQHHDHSNGDLCEEHAKIHHEINKITTNNFGNENIGHRSIKSSETAEEIIALLSQIKSSNLVQPTENFHHCRWCSGQLITV